MKDREGRKVKEDERRHRNREGKTQYLTRQRNHSARQHVQQARYYDEIWYNVKKSQGITTIAKKN